MNKVFFIGLLFTGFNAFAYNAGDIYKALNVDEVDLNPPGLAGASTTEKAVGGLSCVRTLVVVPGVQPTYDCAMSKSGAAEDIYNALNVDEVDLNPPGLAGASTTEKAVGGLSCVRTRVIVPGAVPSFDCTLN